MCVGDDPAPGRLAEHLGQADDRHQAAGDDVGQHLARTDGGKLVDIADDEQRRLVRHRTEQRAHQQDIDHAGLVHDQEIALERMLLGAAELAGARVRLQQAVDRLRLQAGAVRQPLGRPAGGRTQRHANLLGDQHLQDRVDQRGLADPGPAGDHQHLAGQSSPDGLRWLAASCRPVRRSTHGIAVAASIGGQGGPADSRTRNRSAMVCSAR